MQGEFVFIPFLPRANVTEKRNTRHCTLGMTDHVLNTRATATDLAGTGRRRPRMLRMSALDHSKRGMPSRREEQDRPAR